MVGPAGARRRAGAGARRAKPVRPPRGPDADPPLLPGRGPAAHTDVATGVEAVVHRPRRGEPVRGDLYRPALDVPGRVQPPGRVHVEVPVGGPPQLGTGSQYLTQVGGARGRVELA